MSDTSQKHELVAEEPSANQVSLKNIRIDLAFDGGAFSGWQVQPNKRTVQGVLQRTWEKLFPTSKAIIQGCSRTDSGVHAKKFVCHISKVALEKRHWSIEQLTQVLNKVTPDDIWIQQCHIVGDSFHAMRSAQKKTYQYYLATSYESQFKYRKRSLRYTKDINIEKLAQAAAVWQGKKDFRHYCSEPHRYKSTVRNISECQIIQPKPGLIIIQFTANGFLYKMIRYMVGAMLYHQQGKVSLSMIQQSLKNGAQDCIAYRPVAPPHGLHLIEVIYA